MGSPTFEDAVEQLGRLLRGFFLGAVIFGSHGVLMKCGPRQWCAGDQLCRAGSIYITHQTQQASLDAASQQALLLRLLGQLCC